jgi:hypothetical protein
VSAPSRALCVLVDTRDRYACARCGVSIVSVAGSRHHRLKRREGGHSASVLVLLCGSGTTLCHGWVHAHPKAARAAGLIIPAAGRIRPEDVPSIPVKTHEGWMLHDDQGGRERVHEALALELLTSFGMLEVAA